MKTIQTLGEDFTRKHEWLLGAAREMGVALCGGCLVAIARGKTDYVAEDIDFAATKESALSLVSAINRFLLERSVHFRIYVNSKNKFVPDPAVAHFRITAPFWVPICIFVLPTEKFRAYRISGGHWCQIYKDVKAAADELTKTDGKARIGNESIIVPDDWSMDMPFDDDPANLPLVIKGPSLSTS